MYKSVAEVYVSDDNCIVAIKTVDGDYQFYVSETLAFKDIDMSLADVPYVAQRTRALMADIIKVKS